MRSIQTKFIALILGCVLLSSVIIGGAGILSAQKVVDKDSAQLMNLMCSEKARALNGIFSRIEQSVNTLAVYADQELPDVEQFKTSPDVVREYTQRLQSVAVNAANNTEGALAVYARYNPDFTEPTSGLFWSRTALEGRFQQLTPTDFSRYASDDMEHVGWYYIPIDSGKATWMKPYMNKNINVEMISYVIPIYADNTAIGVIGMDIDFSVIKEIVENIKIYDTGYAFLTDEDANIMYHEEVDSGSSMGSLEKSLRPIVDELQNGSSGNYLFLINGTMSKKKWLSARSEMI